MLQPSLVTTENERGHSRQEPKSGNSSGCFDKKAFSASKYSLPLHQHVGKAPKVGNFIFEETTSKREDANNRCSNSGERREGRKEGCENDDKG